MKKNISPEFWRGKKVYLTGHTGFKGSWLSLWLHCLGARVKGFSLPPHTNPSLFDLLQLESSIESEVGDVRDFDAVFSSITKYNPDILIHLAAQPLVRQSYRDPVLTYQTNVMGTVHVLEAARQCSNLRALVNVTTDKCYQNREWEWGYREDDPLGGIDPYSNSKSCSELITSSYRNSFFYRPQSAAIGTARAGNVIGGGDWSEERLLPDLLSAFSRQQAAVVRNPYSIRPWQHVLDPLSGYLILAERLYSDIGRESAEAWNFGPRDDDARSVQWIVDQLIEKWGAGASWKKDDREQPHEANYLKLDISRSKARLNWTPTWSLTIALEKTINWHQAWLAGEDMQTVCKRQISEYTQDMEKKQD